jgi:hypothetical protein
MNCQFCQYQVSLRLVDAPALAESRNFSYEPVTGAHASKSGIGPGTASCWAEARLSLRLYILTVVSFLVKP